MESGVYKESYFTDLSTSCNLNYNSRTKKKDKKGIWCYLFFTGFTKDHAF